MTKWEIKRPYGQEAPFIPFWKFKMRFPGIHYRFEWPDYVQGLLMCAVCLSIIPMLQDILGMPFEVALAIVVLNGFLYLWHTWLGDPVVPGWVTPAIPLIAAWLLSMPMEARMHHLIAFQSLLALWCLFLGATGLSKKVIAAIPAGIKGGVILGAGILAIELVFKKGGRFFAMPVTTTVCIVVGLFCMYNMSFRDLSKTNRAIRFISNLGILPSIVAAIVIAPLVGEAPFSIEWGISSPAFGTLWTDWVPWGKLGWPSMDVYISSIPVVFAAYIVIFGDAVQAQAIIRDADPQRPDEPVEYNANRAHLIVGLRNGIMSVFGPDLSMCGPLWSAMCVVVYERWKKGREAMDSVFGGAACFRFGTFTGYWLLPVVSMTRPILPAALSLTMIIQGFVSVYVGVREAKTLKDLGLCGIVGGVLVGQDAAWALGVGIVAALVMFGKDFFKGDVSAPKLWADQQ